MLQTHIAETGESASISGAILLYGGARSSESAFATVHQVAVIGNRPEIMPGRLLTEDDLVKFTDSMTNNSSTTTHWLDSNVLARGNDRVIWWTVPSKRAMFFAASTHLTAENQVIGSAACPVPALVWVAMPQRGLFVYAVKGSDRPTQETPLYQAPFFNVWGRGKVCPGSAVYPSAEEQWDTKAWEKTFFGSRFTHPNFTQKDRLLKGVNPSRFWKEMLATPAECFPEKHLVKMPLVVADLLDRKLVDTLNALPQPKGEF